MLVNDLIYSLSSNGLLHIQGSNIHAIENELRRFNAGEHPFQLTKPVKAILLTHMISCHSFCLYSAYPYEKMKINTIDNAMK